MSNLEEVTKKLKAQLSLIVAVAENGAIGKNGKMPWHISEELKYFKQITFGKPVLMGRKTFDSLKKPLIGRANIVLSKNVDIKFEQDLPDATSLYFCSDLTQALKLADKLATKMQSKEIMLIGGGSIYHQILDFATRVYLSRVNLTIADADTFFPKLDAEKWNLLKSENRGKFKTEIWQNKLTIGELTNLTTKLETKVDKVLSKFEKMSSDKTKLVQEIQKRKLEVEELDEKSNLKEVTQIKQAMKDINATEDINNFMNKLKEKEDTLVENSPQNLNELEQAQKVEPVKNQETTKEPQEVKETSKNAKVEEILKYWQEKYPQTFFDLEPKPLSIGIHEKLIKETDFPEKLVKRALAQYTKRPRYLRSMQENAARVDFNGETKVKVTKEDELAAKKALDAIKIRNKAKRGTENKTGAYEKKPFRKNFNKGAKFNKDGKSSSFNNAYKNKQTVFAANKNAQQKNRPKNNQAIKPEDAQRLQNKLQKLSDKFNKPN